MTGWLFDTNIVSELRKAKPELKVLEFIKPQPLDKLFISTVTLAEIRFGIDLVSDPTKRSDLSDWLTNRVRPMFTGRTLPVSEDIMLRWQLLVEEGRKIRHTFSQPDLIIAATGLCHGLTIVTRDTADYQLTKVTLFNPWTDQASL